MGRLMDTHEIDEFREIINVPQDAITGTILSEVRSLDERTHLEPFLREILHDPGQTPHGPTEIADVLTTHLHVGTDRKLCAFVIKGRSYQRVSSSDVAHQLLRVREIEGLDVLVLAAVGHVQDDAKRDFFQVVYDGAYDHLILDVQELARLLIVYGKLCPTDGTPFDDESRRLELLRSFNEIPGVSIREDSISGRPALDLSALRDKAAMKRFLDALDWAIEEWKSA